MNGAVLRLEVSRLTRATLRSPIGSLTDSALQPYITRHHVVIRPKAAPIRGAEMNHQRLKPAHVQAQAQAVE